MKIEVLLKCAKKAFPDVEWKQGRRLDYVRCAARRFKFRLHYQIDQMALQEALEKEGWAFSYECNEYCATKTIRKPVKVGDMDGYSERSIEIEAPTKLELLYRIVEQTP